MTELVTHEMIRYLEGRGIKHIFGLCGHTNIAFLSELEKSSKITFVNTRHEQIASHAADGYARVTGKASVVLSHLGPGLTNAATGVANAALDSIPMVVIAGDVQSYYFGKHPHQEVNYHDDGDQYSIYKPFVKRAFRVTDPNLIPEVLDRAFVIAESGRPGPVLVDVPMDVFSSQIETNLVDRVLNNHIDYAKPTIDEATAEKIIANLLAAERPLLYLGGGIRIANAHEEVTKFADRLQLPIAHSLMGKGAVADTNPLVMGMSGFWGMEITNQYCLSADWILGLGTRFAEADCSSWYEDYTFKMPPSKLMQIDIDPTQIGRNYPVELGAVADLKEALVVLNRVAERLVPEGSLNRDELIAQIAEARENKKKMLVEDQQSDSWPMNPARILKVLSEKMDPDAFLLTDVGWNKNGVGQQMELTTPGQFLTPGGLATMGFGSPGALGAKIAAGDRQVIALIGDGGFGQNPAVLATARRENIAAIWLVMNNNAFGTIAGLQAANYGTTFGTTFKRGEETFYINYAEIAKGYHVESAQVTSPENFDEVLDQAFEVTKAGRPFLIDVPMRNIPTPTPGYWDILHVYNPDGNAPAHVETD